MILPAYNEAPRLPGSLSRCAEFFHEKGLRAEIIVVDDGSSDGTRAAFGRAAADLGGGGVSLFYLPVRHAGKGAAIRAGIRHASGDPIVFLDTDLTIPVEIVERFLIALEAGADIAVASRFVAGSRSKRPFWRRVMGRTFRAFVRVLVPTGVQDTQCGGKAYTAEAARDLFSRQTIDGFAFDAEVLYLARCRGYRIVEIPFTIHQRGPTSIDFLAEAPKMFMDLIRIRMNAISGRYE